MANYPFEMIDHPFKTSVTDPGLVGWVMIAATHTRTWVASGGSIYLSRVDSRSTFGRVY